MALVGPLGETETTSFTDLARAGTLVANSAIGKRSVHNAAQYSAKAQGQPSWLRRCNRTIAGCRRGIAGVPASHFPGTHRTCTAYVTRAHASDSKATFTGLHCRPKQ